MCGGRRRYYLHTRDSEHVPVDLEPSVMLSTIKLLKMPKPALLQLHLINQNISGSIHMHIV